MGYTFPGIKKDDNGLYYYDEADIPEIRVPIAKEFKGNFDITLEQLDHWFGVSHTLPPLSKYLVLPRLDSTWNYNSNNGWDVTGEMIVYEPVEWVPVVTTTRTFARDEVETTFKQTYTKTDTSKLYGRLQTELKVSGGTNLYGVKVEASVTAEASVEAKRETEKIETITKEGKLGNKVVHEVWVAMSLKVRKVYSRKIQLWNANNGGKQEVSWSGGPSWGDIWIGSRELRRVEGLQYSNIAMSGGGASNRIYFQVLPQVEGGELKDLHMAVSNVGWQDWYAYVPDYSAGKKVDSTEHLVWRAWEPRVTLLTLEKD